MNSFRLPLLAAYFLYVAYWFAPYFYQYLTPEEGGVLANYGFNAHVSAPEQLDLIVFLLWTIATVALLLGKLMFVWLLIALMSYSVVSAPLFGIVVLTGYEAAMLDLSTFLYGFSSCQILFLKSRKVMGHPVRHEAAH